jgi:protoporphyrinogen/coproporphyrinogen III oxidase
VTLLEASSRLGGKVGTHRIGELLVEQGPDAVFTMKPWAVELIEELGMADELIEPLRNGFSILVGGRLHPVPRALATLMPSASGMLEKVAFLGAAAKRRILAEREAPRGSGDDESIASFFRRRFGRRFSSLVAEPLLAGIHAGDPERLSMKALYPGYLGLEQKNGSLTGAAPAAPGGPRRPAFLSLKGGMGSLVERLGERLENVRVVTDGHVDRIEPGLRVVGAVDLQADHVIVAVPAHVAGCMLADLAPASTAALRRIRHVSTVVATLGYPIEAFPGGLEGNGFLVPYAEPAEITGCSWSSSKWAGRAPEGTALLRVFMGRDGGLPVDAHTDDELADKAKAAMRSILGATMDPTFVHVDRWTKAMPQYDLGHLELLAEAEAGLKGLPIYLAGSSFRGTGIPDCVRQGREAARWVSSESPGTAGHAK